MTKPNDALTIEEILDAEKTNLTLAKLTDGRLAIIVEDPTSVLDRSVNNKSDIIADANNREGWLQAETNHGFYRIQCVVVRPDRRNQGLQPAAKAHTNGGF